MLIVAVSGTHRRRVDSPIGSRELSSPSTERAENPFVTRQPDDWFLCGSKLKKVRSAAERLPMSAMPSAHSQRGPHESNDVIVFKSAQSTFRRLATGGAPTPVTALIAETRCIASPRSCQMSILSFPALSESQPQLRLDADLHRVDPGQRNPNERDVCSRAPAVRNDTLIAQPFDPRCVS